MRKTFNDWYEEFTEILFLNKYDRSIDKDQARSDYDKNMSPEESAAAFLDEITK